MIANLDVCELAGMLLNRGSIDFINWDVYHNPWSTWQPVVNMATHGQHGVLANKVFSAKAGRCIMAIRWFSSASIGMYILVITSAQCSTYVVTQLTITSEVQNWIKSSAFSIWCSVWFTQKLNISLVITVVHYCVMELAQYTDAMI